MNIISQWEVIKTLQHKLRLEENVRVDCPFCGGKNTLSISKHRGIYIWNCYRASCSAKGRKKTELSLTDISQISKPTSSSSEPEFLVPASFISPIWHDEALSYMNRMHCLVAFEAGAVQVYYDPTRDRVVFMTTNKAGSVVDANGRSLNRNANPKWYRYGKSTQPFLCNRGQKKLVIVEDAPSACAVFPMFTGMALQGTNFSISAINEIKDYEQVFVCLDPDAYKKGIEIRQKLAYICKNVHTLFIPNDLKYFNQEEIRKIIHE